MPVGIGEASSSPGVLEFCFAAVTTLLAISLVMLWRQQITMQRLLTEQQEQRAKYIADKPPTADSISYQVAPAAPTRNVGTRLRQYMSIQDFGAVPDGKTPADTAIQAAVDMHKVRPGGVEVFIPAGRYLVTKPINITNLAGGGVTVRGELCGLFGDSGAILVGATGAAVLDCSGSQYINISDLSIVSPPVAPGSAPMLSSPSSASLPSSVIGILFARTKKSEFAQFNTVRNVAIDLDSNPKANNNNGSVGLYASAAELLSLDNIYFRADYGMCNVCLNDFKVVSDFASISAIYMSNSCITVSGQSTLSTKLATGAAWLGSNAIGVRMENLYLQALTPKPEPSRLENSGIDAHAADIQAAALLQSPPKQGVGLRIEGGHHLTFFGHAEGPSRIAEFTASATDVSLSFTGIKAMQNSPIAAGMIGGSNGGFVGTNFVQYKSRMVESEKLCKDSNSPYGSE